MFRTFIAYFKIGWQQDLYYRGSFFINALAKVFTFLFVIILWLKIFESRENIGSYTLSGILTYYLFSFVIRNFLSPDVIKTISWSIKNGTLQILLLRPSSLLTFYFADNIARRLLQFFVNLIVLLIIIIFFYRILDFHFTFFGVSQFIAFLIIGLFLVFYIAITVASLGFWLINMSPVNAVFSGITSMLSGGLLPISFFPGLAGSIIREMPFRYLVYDPIRALQNQIGLEEVKLIVAKMLIWILIFFLLSNLLWKIGLKRFEAVGN